MHGSASTTGNVRKGNGTLRRRVFHALEIAQDGNNRLSRAIDVFLIILISASVVAVIIESMPGVEARYGNALALFEAFTIAVFTVEYFLRVWSSVEAESTNNTSA